MTIEEVIRKPWDEVAYNEQAKNILALHWQGCKSGRRPPCCIRIIRDHYDKLLRRLNYRGHI